jgi:hypothetical protein
MIICSKTCNGFIDFIGVDKVRTKHSHVPVMPTCPDSGTPIGHLIIKLNAANSEIPTFVGKTCNRFIDSIDVE